MHASSPPYQYLIVIHTLLLNIKNIQYAYVKVFTFHFPCHVLQSISFVELVVFVYLTTHDFPQFQLFYKPCIRPGQKVVEDVLIL